MTSRRKAQRDLWAKSQADWNHRQRAERHKPKPQPIVGVVKLPPPPDPPEYEPAEDTRNDR